MSSAEYKIAWGNLAKFPQFAICKSGYYINAPAVLTVSNSKYLLGILNSKISNYFIMQSAAVRQGGFVEFKPMYVSQVPIPECNEKQERDMSSLVLKLQDHKLSDQEIKMLESEVDKSIFDLYKFSDKEVKLIYIMTA